MSSVCRGWPADPELKTNDELTKDRNALAAGLRMLDESPGIRKDTNIDVSDRFEASNAQNTHPSFVVAGGCTIRMLNIPTLF